MVISIYLSSIIHSFIHPSIYPSSIHLVFYLSIHHILVLCSEELMLAHMTHLLRHVGRRKSLILRFLYGVGRAGLLSQSQVLDSTSPYTWSDVGRAKRSPPNSIICADLVSFCCHNTTKYCFLVCPLSSPDSKSGYFPSSPLATSFTFIANPRKMASKCLLELERLPFVLQLSA